MQKNKRRIPKIFSIKMQGRLFFVFIIVMLAMTGLIVKLLWLNRVDGDRYAKKVLAQQTYTDNAIPYKRGDIVDSKGTVLATSEKVYNLILDVKNLIRKEEFVNPTIKAITSCYPDITSDELKDYITNRPNSHYIILKKGLSYDEKILFQDLATKDKKIQGVWFEEDFVRRYPYKTLADDVLGFTSSGNVGNWGIEQYYNEELNGMNGIEYGYMNTELDLERVIKPPVNGNTIVSTIDANVQGIVQKHIKTFNEEIGSLNIGVLMMNPNNGEILAMASNNDYDLNKPTDLSPFYTEEEIENMSEEERLTSLNQIWRNFVISDSFEPGSTFKPFTIASALEEDIVKPDSTYICDGKEVAGGWTIKCSSRRGHGVINLTETLMKSCNDALMQIVAMEGRSLFYNYQNFFGFGLRSGIDLPGEAVGLLIAEDKLNGAELATSSFGQTFTTTMMQLAAGYSSLINGGYYYQPHIVKQILNSEGGIVKNIEKTLVRQTVSGDTSEFIREAMYQTVSAGTAKAAGVPGYKVGGKTGTAEKLPRSEDKYIVSFIGGVPADRPEVVIYVVIDEPQNVVKQADSKIATKFTSDLLKEVLPFLEIYPTEETEENIENNENGLVNNNTGNTLGNGNDQGLENNDSNTETGEDTDDISNDNENTPGADNDGIQETDNNSEFNNNNEVEDSTNNNSGEDSFGIDNTDSGEDLDDNEFNAEALPNFDEAGNIISDEAGNIEGDEDSNNNND